MITIFIAWAQEQVAKDPTLSIHVHPTSYKASEWGVTITLYRDFMKRASLYVACDSYDDAKAKCLEILK